MTAQSYTSADEALVRLSWDSSHFGFEVGTINRSDLDDLDLENVLLQARARVFELVYWATGPDRNPRSDLLEQFGGQLVDRKMTYTRSLDAPSSCKAIESERGKDASFRIQEFPPGPASDELIALAAAAARCSRYRRDLRFPAVLTERMYTTWIERSTLREIADTVLSAVDTQGNTVGMITLCGKGDTCHIGLLAVDAAVRRGGIGRLLLRAGHKWITKQGITRSTVVTQAENVPACRLYERCGYRVHESNNVYHFWPL